MRAKPSVGNHICKGSVLTFVISYIGCSPLPSQKHCFKTLHFHYSFNSLLSRALCWFLTHTTYCYPPYYKALNHFRDQSSLKNNRSITTANATRKLILQRLSITTRLFISLSVFQLLLDCKLTAVMSELKEDTSSKEATVSMQMIRFQGSPFYDFWKLNWNNLITIVDFTDKFCYCFRNPNTLITFFFIHLENLDTPLIKLHFQPAQQHFIAGPQLTAVVSGKEIGKCYRNSLLSEVSLNICGGT